MTTVDTRVKVQVIDLALRDVAERQAAWLAEIAKLMQMAAVWDERRNALLDERLAIMEGES